MESSSEYIMNAEDNARAEDSGEKERNLRLREKVFDEIISSEKAYIDQLDLLLNVRMLKTKWLLILGISIRKFAIKILCTLY